MISDHYLLFRYVLFKRHYEKYISLSKKYEEAKNMVYYLEEKYHEVKVSALLLASGVLNFILFFSLPFNWVIDSDIGEFLKDNFCMK